MAEGGGGGWRGLRVWWGREEGNGTGRAWKEAAGRDTGNRSSNASALLYPKLTCTFMQCNIGLVVEFSPATRETRVRFPDVALTFFCPSSPPRAGSCSPQLRAPRGPSRPLSLARAWRTSGPCREMESLSSLSSSRCKTRTNRPFVPLPDIGEPARSKFVDSERQYQSKFPTQLVRRSPCLWVRRRRALTFTSREVFWERLACIFVTAPHGPYRPIGTAILRSTANHSITELHTLPA